MHLTDMSFTSWKRENGRASHLEPARLFVLRPDRVEVTEDTKIPNAATIKIVKQDHTLANLLRS